VNTPAKLTGGAVPLGDREVHDADAFDVLLACSRYLRSSSSPAGNQGRLALLNGGSGPDPGIEEGYCVR